MGSFMLRRIGQSIVILFGISIVIFLFMHAVPGGPAAMFRDKPGMTAQKLIAIEASYGLNRPLYLQYWSWLTSALRGNFGYSYTYGRPALAMMLERLPATAELMLTSFAVAIAVSTVIGVFSAVHQYSVWDFGATIFAYVGVSLPTFVLGIVALLVFAVRLHWLPAGGITSSVSAPTLIDRLRHLILPAAVLAFYSLAGESRYTRSSMLEVLHADYVRTARAKGLSERAVIYRHAFRTALIPIVTILTLDFAYLFGGTLITETIFAWPGMGRLFMQAVLQGDYPVMMVVLSFLSVLIVFANVAADVFYAVLDPRIRYA